MRAIRSLTSAVVVPNRIFMTAFLDFEKPVAELQARIAELRESAGSADIEPEIARLEGKADKLLHDIYAKLTPWQKTQIARHPDRPHFKD